MAITWLIEDTFKRGRHKIVRALLRENSTVKRVEVTLAANASPTAEDAQAAWDAADPLPNGLAAWNRAELEDTDEAGRGAIAAILDVVRVGPNPSLSAMTAAGLAALDDHPKQLIAYNRVKSAMDAATLQQVKDFVSLMSVITVSKLGQRPR